MDITQLTAWQLKELLDRKKISPLETATAYCRRISDLNEHLNVFVSFDPERVLQAARSARPGKLSGIPLAVKDNICVQNEPTTCASRILAGFRPPYQATVINRLQQEGAILLGKTNMDEFAFGSSCETSCYGPTRNPWNPGCAPGGSSGGSAAAVAARMAPLAIGSDTGGSIRQPAAFCGVVGMKPTYGRVSRYGLIAFASSLDQIGPFSTDIRDAALLLNVISGKDPHDATSVSTPVPDYTAALDADLSGLRIGLPREYFAEGLDPEVESTVRTAVELLRGRGAQIRTVSLPHTPYAVATYYIIAPSEASSNLARFDGVSYGLRSAGAAIDPRPLIDMYLQTRRDGFGDEAKRRILLGTFALSSGYYDAYYLKALKVRTLISRDFQQAFTDCDCLVTPTAPTPAFPLGERLDDPLAMYLSDVFTIPANLAGLPAVSLPCGFSAAGLPIGLQLLGKPFSENVLLRIGYAYQQLTDWHTRRPESNLTHKADGRHV